MPTRTRRVKWHPSPPPSTSRTTNTRRRKPTTTVDKPPETEEIIQTYNYKGNLERLFGEERKFARPPVERVAEDGGGGGGGEVAEERWRLQAEALRAECELLRMERNHEMKKVEMNRIRMERSLESALKIVDSGRRKLCEGKNVEEVMEKEIKELSEKLKELQSGYNDEVNGDWSILTSKSPNKSTNGMLDQMEKDYRSIINNSVANSASTSNRISDHFSFSNRVSNQAKEPLVSQGASDKCSGRCRLLVRRMVEQVRSDTEQWSQMQEMLGQLRKEMEELQTSKDFWETQALVSNKEIQSLMIDVEEWRVKAVGYETKVITLQREVNRVKGELEKLKKDQMNKTNSPTEKEIVSLSKQIERETKNGWSCRMKGQLDAISSNRHEKVEKCKKDSPPLSLAKQLSREKRIMISQLKEHTSNNKEISGDGRRKGYVRSPFTNIGNLSSSSSSSSSMGMIRQNGNVVFPL